MGYRKIVQYGNVTEVFDYEKNLKTENKRTIKANLRKNNNKLYHAIYGTTDIKKERQKRVLASTRKKGIYTRSPSSIRRAKTTFFKLCHHNNVYADTIHFVTLTFSFDVTYEKARQYQSDFFKRLKQQFEESPISYISVPELTKKGRFHFHILVYNLPPETEENERSTRNIQRQFQRGYVDVRFAAYNSSGIAGYMAKYMSKALTDPKYETVRGYNCSRNIKKFRSFGSNTLNEYEDMIIPTSNVANVEKATYDVPYLGTCSYRKITTKI